jgi:predicted nucleotidyltransferase component of viral defense system
MTSRKPGNITASVRQRLLNNARETERPFNEILQYFAMERFLYRLSKSPHAEKFILKGALMLTVWRAPLSRSTMDIDMLGQTDNSVDSIIAIVKDVCQQEVEPDGLVFDATSVEGERITEEVNYEGIRVRFRGRLGTARVTIQFDVGFGDIVIPSPVTTDYPTLLDLPAPRLRGYSKESTVAEKFEAMVKLDMLNSRMKDFFDIWLLSRQFDYDGKTLTEAIMKTFTTRGTEIPSSPVPFSDKFSSDATKVTQWRGFIRKGRLADTPEEFKEIIEKIADFLGPIAESLAAGRTFKGSWKAPGPWKT